VKRWLPAPADVVCVHRATTEVEAIAVEQVLRASGLRVWVRSRQVPGYATVIASASGVWGDVMVAAEDADRAREVLAGYLAALASGQ